METLVFSLPLKKSKTFDFFLIIYLKTPVCVDDSAEGEETVSDGMTRDESHWKNSQSDNGHDPLVGPVLRRQHTAFSVKPEGAIHLD